MRFHLSLKVSTRKDKLATWDFVSYQVLTMLNLTAFAIMNRSEATVPSRQVPEQCGQDRLDTGEEDSARSCWTRCATLTRTKTCDLLPTNKW